jgi:hypothetical protein
MQTIENIFGKSAKEIIKAELDLKAKELKIPKRSGLKKAELIEKIVEYVNNPPIEDKSKPKKKVKKTIPKTLKNMVWDKYIGREKGTGECNCCHNEIDAKHFECGHVLSEAKGGELSINNLRPVCSLCNKSMNTQNMEEFSQIIKVDNPLNNMRQLLKTYKFVNEQPKITWTKYVHKINIFDSCFDGNRNRNSMGMIGHSELNELMGNRGSGQYTSKSNINELTQAGDYENIVINKLTKLWCDYNTLLKLGEDCSLDKYDVNKCILEKKENNKFSKKIIELDYEYVLVDIYTLSEFVKLGTQVNK